MDYDDVDRPLVSFSSSSRPGSLWIAPRHKFIERLRHQTVALQTSEYLGLSTVDAVNIGQMDRCVEYCP